MRSHGHSPPIRFSAHRPLIPHVHFRIGIGPRHAAVKSSPRSGAAPRTSYRSFNLADRLWVPDYRGLAPGGGSAWTVYPGEGDLVGRVTASEIGITVLAADEDVVAVLATDELGVQTVQLRRIIERP